VAVRRASKSLKTRLRAVLGRAKDPSLLIELLKELNQIGLDAAAALGVSAKDRRRAVHLAVKDSKRRRPSLHTLQTNRGFSAILYHWRNDKRFRQANGEPRVLAIKGRGVTLESLAKRYVPGVALNEVTAMICDNAEVRRVSDGKVALVGAAVMMTPKTPEQTMASLISRTRRITETILHDATLPPRRTDSGRFERVVSGELTDREFEAFAQSMRHQLQNVCDQVDERIGQPARKSKRGRVSQCGLGIYVFKDGRKLR
jgi:hypothetical protein